MAHFYFKICNLELSFYEVDHSPHFCSLHNIHIFSKIDFLIRSTTLFFSQKYFFFIPSTTFSFSQKIILFSFPPQHSSFSQKYIFPKTLYFCKSHFFDPSGNPLIYSLWKPSHLETHTPHFIIVHPSYKNLNLTLITLISHTTRIHTNMQQRNYETWK